MPFDACRRGAVAVLLWCAAAGAVAQEPDAWWAPVPRDVRGSSWIGVDAEGFGPVELVVQLDLRAQTTRGARGYWVTHLRAGYAAAQDLPGVDGEQVRTAEVFVAMLLDCDRGTWLLAGAYGAVADGKDTVLAPLSHTGLNATEVAMDRIARLACRPRLRVATETAPAGTVLVDRGGRAPTR